MADIVVIGGGIGGLSAALFLARRGHDVTVLERDAAPAAGTPEDDFACWHRPGVPHARQSHYFLALAARVLHEEAAEVLTELQARGVPSVPLALPADGGRGGAGERNMLARRLVFEAVLRRQVERESGVVVRSGERATGLLAASEQRGVPVVGGVRTSAGEEIRAALVVNAAGRRSPVIMKWLRDLGSRPPVSHEQRVGFFYLTRHFRLRPGTDFPSTRVPNGVRLDYAAAIAFPADNRTFSLTVTAASRDPYGKRLRDPRVYDRFLGAVPLTAPWIERGEPIDEPKPMAHTDNRWQRLTSRHGQPVAGGMVLVGDAAVHTNPTSSLGVSLALAHAQQLARMAGQAADDPVGFVARFESWTDEHLGVLFRHQVALDRHRAREIGAVLRGRRPPASDDPVLRFFAAALALSEEDPVVAAAYSRSVNLLITPPELARDREVHRRVLRYLRANPAADLRGQGPDRAEFETMVGL